MQRSIYLARLIGPVFAAIGLGVLLNSGTMRGLGEEFLRSHALIFLSGLLTLTAGLAIVLAHNVWDGSWRVIITVFGWLGVIGGVLRITAPQWVATVGSSMFESAATPVVSGIAVLAVGAVLSYFGYAEFFSAAQAPRTARKGSRRS